MAAMSAKLSRLSLTYAEAACLKALRPGTTSKMGIAIQAKLDLRKTDRAIETLARLGLAQLNKDGKWRPTRKGATCRFVITSEPPRREKRGRPASVHPGPGGQRLLAMLDHPMRGSEIVEKLGLTRQRVDQLIVELYAKGHIRLGDPAQPFWLVIRADDNTHFLSPAEERVLSAIPHDYVTNATKIRLAARVGEDSLHDYLAKLVRLNLVQASEGLRGEHVYRVTPAGFNHPQRIQSARRAEEPRLPVESERVHKVLSVISSFGELRIKDVRNLLQIPQLSINALMQYLKRKGLVAKTGLALADPYALTPAGYSALAEMERRQAA